MTATELLAVFVRRWGVIAIACISSLGGAAAYLAYAGATYEARADVLITPVAADEAVAGTGVIVDSIESIRYIQTAVVLINTDDAAVRTADLMGGDWTPGMVVDAVDVAPRGQSSVVSITARASDPRDASDLATIFASEALDQRDEDVRQRSQELLEEREAELDGGELANLDATATRAVEAELTTLRVLTANGDPSMTLINPAAAPRQPSSPGALMVLVLATAIGLLVGGALSLVLDQWLTSQKPPVASRANSRSGDWLPPTTPQPSPRDAKSPSIASARTMTADRPLSETGQQQ